MTRTGGNASGPAYADGDVPAVVELTITVQFTNVTVTDETNGISKGFSRTFSGPASLRARYLPGTALSPSYVRQHAVERPRHLLGLQRLDEVARVADLRPPPLPSHRRNCASVGRPRHSGCFWSVRKERMSP